MKSVIKKLFTSNSSNSNSSSNSSSNNNNHKISSPISTSITERSTETTKTSDYNYNDDFGNDQVSIEPVKEILETTFEIPTQTIRGEPINTSKPKRVFKFASDIHLENRENIGELKSMSSFRSIYEFERTPGTRYFLALVGDIGSPFRKADILTEFLQICSSSFNQVFYVMGNHEYYNRENKTMDQVEKELRRICNQFRNVHLLENQVYHLDEYKIVGTTLWSNVKLRRDDVERYLVDYHLIRVLDESGGFTQDGKIKTRCITVDDTNFLHNKAIQFLEKEVFSDENTSPCIVLTHHAPQFNDHKRQLYTSHPKYSPDDNISEGFSTNLSNLLKYPIVAYIFGHTHFSTKYKYNGVTILANQYGYEYGESRFNKFNPNRHFIL